ncbi:MAG: 3'-5' exonuclease [Mariprofundaceae bacterium]|nr:3'-5' exonuclease [Mariprofundaceae bacterium]
MMKDTLVFNIQTVPDAEAARRLLEHPEWSDQQARDDVMDYFLQKNEGKSDFPRHPFHQVVVISYAYLVAERDEHGTQWVLKRIASGGTSESSEKELLEGFFHLIETRTPRLVSFNGRGFAIPVLKYRAMVHGLSCPKWVSSGNRWDHYEARYSSVYHVDLLEVLSDYGASIRCSLSEIAAVFHVPRVLSEENARELFESGGLSVLRDHCETDVCSILLIFLRWQLFQGALNQETYAYLMQSIHNYLTIESEEKAHFSNVLEAWD